MFLGSLSLRSTLVFINKEKKWRSYCWRTWWVRANEFKGWEVKLSTKWPCDPVTLAPLCVDTKNRNSTISIAPRQYISDGSESTWDTSFENVTPFLRGEAGEESVFSIPKTYLSRPLCSSAHGALLTLIDIYFSLWLWAVIHVPEHVERVVNMWRG